MYLVLYIPITEDQTHLLLELLGLLLYPFIGCLEHLLVGLSKLMVGSTLPRELLLQLLFLQFHGLLIELLNLLLEMLLSYAPTSHCCCS